MWRLNRGGGVQTVVRQLAENLDPSQVQLHVVTARPRVETDQIDVLPVTHHSLELGFDDGHRLTARLLCALRAVKVLKVIRPDVIHLHTGTAWLGFFAALAMPRVPVVLEVHDAPGSGRHGSKTDLLEGLWARLRRATVICHSSSVAAEISSRWRIRPSLLRRFPLAADLAKYASGADSDNHAVTAPPFTTTPDAFVLVVAGRMVLSKRFDLALDASRLLALRAVKCVLVLIGDGPERANLLEHAHQLGIAEQVVFAGSRFDTDLVRSLRACDVLLSTSEYEGFGLTLVEGMAAALPTVAMSVGGITDIVLNGETGFLVGPGDLEGMVDRLEELASNPDLRARMGEAGKARAFNNFGADSTVASFCNLYRDLVGD